MNLVRRQARNQKGFTLVELMVVVVIIGILVAIAIPVFNSTMTRAKQRADDANIRTLNGVVSTKVASEPATDYTFIANNATITNVNGVATAADAGISGLVGVDNYLTELPLPTAGITYTYTQSTGTFAKSGTY
jgi:prepilin-type N-terminal cleavage/methylation domain-containing protein